MVVAEKNVSLVALTFEELQTLYQALESLKKEKHYDKDLTAKLSGEIGVLIRDLRIEGDFY